MKKKILIFSLCLLLSVGIVQAAILDVTKVGHISDWENYFFSSLRYIMTDIIGFPHEWTQFPEFLYYFILPLAGIMTIVYGFLDQMKIFEDPKINKILAVVIAFSALVSRAFIGIVKLMFGLLGPISVGVFAIIFISGLGYMIKKKNMEWGTRGSVLETYYDEAERLKNDLKENRDMYSKLMKEYARTKDDKKRKGIEKRVGELKKEIDNLEVRLEEMKDMMDHPL